MEPQKRPQGQGGRPEGFLAQASTPRQAFRNWTHGMAAHYSVAFGHGARWTDSYTLATGRHPHLPWELWQLTPRGPRHSQGSSRQCSFPGWQGMRKERLWRTKVPGCWAPRNNRSLLDSVFLPLFLNTWLFLSQGIKLPQGMCINILFVLKVLFLLLPCWEVSSISLKSPSLFYSGSSGGCVGTQNTPSPFTVPSALIPATAAPHSPSPQD